MTYFVLFSAIKDYVSVRPKGRVELESRPKVFQETPNLCRKISLLLPVRDPGGCLIRGDSGTEVGISGTYTVIGGVAETFLSS